MPLTQDKHIVDWEIQSKPWWRILANKESGSAETSRMPVETPNNNSGMKKASNVTPKPARIVKGVNTRGEKIDEMERAVGETEQV